MQGCALGKGLTLLVVDSLLQNIFFANGFAGYANLFPLPPPPFCPSLLFAAAVARREAQALLDKELTERIMQERGERLAMVTGGLLLSLFNKRTRVLRTVYVSIKHLVDIMESNPAVKQ